MLNQNNEQGYAAEDKLGSLIRLEFQEINWTGPTQPQNKTPAQEDNLISAENQREHHFSSDRRFFGGREKITEILLDRVSLIASVLFCVALVGTATYHAFLYYLEHYLLAALGMMVGIVAGCVLHEFWVERISFGLFYGLCVLLGAWLLFGLLSMGGGDPDCFGPSRYC